MWGGFGEVVLGLVLESGFGEWSVDGSIGGRFVWEKIIIYE